MADYEAGTLLTCHDRVCRVRIEIERQYAKAGNRYLCPCGDEMVTID
nr:metallothionein [Mycobacterium intracellulare]